MPFPIRELRSEELSAAVPLRHAMVLEIEDEDLDRTSPGWRDRYVAFFDSYIRQGKGAVWVAETGGDIVGIAAAYMPSNHRTEIMLSSMMYICNVYVSPKWRRQGVARALTLHAVGWARGKNCRVVRLRTSDMGRPLYESIGFEPSSELELFL